MSLCARRAGVLAGRACCRTGLLAGGAARASLARAARSPAGTALWPVRPADAVGDGFGLARTAQRHNGTTAQRHNGTTAERQNGTTAQRHNGTTAQRHNGRG
jgi:hypothetical protein